MSTGKILFVSLIALALAICASSTASAHSRFSVGFTAGAPMWGSYVAYPGYYYAPAPVVAYPYPYAYYYPAPYAVAYPAAGPVFSFGYYGR